MKKTSILFFLLFVILPSFAQDKVISLVIETQTGEQAIEFDRLRRITFSGTTVNMLKTDGSTLNYDMGDIYRITNSLNDNTSVAEIEHGGRELVSYIDADNIAVNCSAGTVVTIYGISGSHIQTARADSDNCIINIAALPKGIYLLHADGRTSKFFKK